MFHRNSSSNLGYLIICEDPTRVWLDNRELSINIELSQTGPRTFMAETLASKSILGQKYYLYAQIAMIKAHFLTPHDKFAERAPSFPASRNWLQSVLFSLHLHPKTPKKVCNSDRYSVHASSLFKFAIIHTEIIKKYKVDFVRNYSFAAIKFH